MPVDAYPRCMACGGKVWFDYEVGVWRHYLLAAGEWLDKGCRSEPVGLYWPRDAAHPFSEPPALPFSPIAVGSRGTAPRLP